MDKITQPAVKDFFETKQPETFTKEAKDEDQLKRPALLYLLHQQISSILADPTKLGQQDAETIRNFCQKYKDIFEEDFTELSYKAQLLCLKRENPSDWSYTRKSSWTSLASDYRATGLFKDNDQLLNFIRAIPQNPPVSLDILYDALQSDILANPYEFKEKVGRLEQWAHSQGLVKKDELLNRIYEQIPQLSKEPLHQNDRTRLIEFSEQMAQSTHDKKWHVLGEIIRIDGNDNLTQAPDDRGIYERYITDPRQNNLFKQPSDFFNFLNSTPMSDIKTVEDLQQALQKYLEREIRGENFHQHQNEFVRWSYQDRRIKTDGLQARILAECHKIDPAKLPPETQDKMYQLAYNFERTYNGAWEGICHQFLMSVQPPTSTQYNRQTINEFARASDWASVIRQADLPNHNPLTQLRFCLQLCHDIQAPNLDMDFQLRSALALINKSGCPYPEIFATTYIKLHTPLFADPSQPNSPDVLFNQPSDLIAFLESPHNISSLSHTLINIAEYTAGKEILNQGAVINQTLNPWTTIDRLASQSCQLLKIMELTCAGPPWPPVVENLLQLINISDNKDDLYAVLKSKVPQIPALSEINKRPTYQRRSQADISPLQWTLHAPGLVSRQKDTLLKTIDIINIYRKEKGYAPLHQGKGLIFETAKTALGIKNQWGDTIDLLQNDITKINTSTSGILNFIKDISQGIKKISKNTKAPISTYKLIRALTHTHIMSHIWHFLTQKKETKQLPTQNASKKTWPITKATSLVSHLFSNIFNIFHIVKSNEILEDLKSSGFSDLANFIESYLKFENNVTTLLFGRKATNGNPEIYGIVDQVYDLLDVIDKTTAHTSTAVPQGIVKDDLKKLLHKSEECHSACNNMETTTRDMKQKFHKLFSSSHIPISGLSSDPAITNFLRAIRIEYDERPQTAPKLNQEAPPKHEKIVATNVSVDDYEKTITETMPLAWQSVNKILENIHLLTQLISSTKPTLQNGNIIDIESLESFLENTSSGINSVMEKLKQRVEKKEFSLGIPKLLLLYNWPKVSSPLFNILKIAFKISPFGWIFIYRDIKTIGRAKDAVKNAIDAHQKLKNILTEKASVKGACKQLRNVIDILQDLGKPPQGGQANSQANIERKISHLVKLIHELGDTKTKLEPFITHDDNNTMHEIQTHLGTFLSNMVDCFNNPFLQVLGQNYIKDEQILNQIHSFLMDIGTGENRSSLSLRSVVDRIQSSQLVLRNMSANQRELGQDAQHPPSDQSHHP